jgi:phospholipase A2-like protein
MAARRKFVSMVASVAGGLALVISLALPAQAVTTDQKLAALSGFSQTSAASQSSWLAARADQGAWAAYAFDWSTDYCSDSPDNPLGFPFRLPCARHDFNYRNYKAVNRFDANKARIDSALYADLGRVCARYSGATRTACNGLAWTYYQAVKTFGSLTNTQAGIDRAARQLPVAERADRQAAQDVLG